MNILKKYNSWTWERVLRHILYWCGWGLFYISINTLIKDDNISLSQWICFELLVLPIKITSAYLIAYLIMPRFLYKRKYLLFFVYSLMVFIIMGCLLFLMYAQVVYPYVIKINYSTLYVKSFIYKGIELVHITSLVICIKFFQNMIHQEKISNQLMQEKNTAELKYLKNQIQPHFLFNTLNNLYGMVLSKDKNAPETIVKLSEMLSYMLYESNTPFVPLKEELEHLDNYISLERLRYERKLDFQYNLAEIPSDLKIAPLLLLPFVENAFKHGPAMEEGKSMIVIDLQIENKTLIFTVKNTYLKAAIDAKIHSGIGLSNVRKRLALLYPNKYDLSITAGDLYEINLQVKLT